jgi:hypothetical protein
MTKLSTEMEPYYNAITALTDEFSDKYLNVEYKELARKAIATLCRKRPSPVVTGTTKVWACGVIHALGTVNFLFDKSQTPHVTNGEMIDFFGVAKSTTSSKSKNIRDMLKMNHFDHKWLIPSRVDNSIMTWMLEINGFCVDIRTMPRHIQEIAFQKNLIPYISADRVSA